VLGRELDVTLGVDGRLTKVTLVAPQGNL